MNNTIRTWRDLSGLTETQVTLLAAREALFLGDGRPQGLVAEILLEAAVDHVAANMVDRTRFGHLPDPPGATRIWHWGRDEVTGKWDRAFEGRSWEIGDLTLDINGNQFEDGTVTYYLNVDASCLCFNGTGAKALADAVTAAAVELDRLNGGAR